MEIRIGKTARQCHATGLPFAHKARVVSLVRTHEDGLVREDYASEAWNDGYGEGALAVWTTEYVDPACVEDVQREEERSPVRELFYSCHESQDRVAMAKAFLAAQLLKRQRAFRLVRESSGDEAEGHTYLYLDRNGDRLVEVRDPGLTFGELEQARTELLGALAAQEEADAMEGEPRDAEGVENG